MEKNSMLYVRGFYIVKGQRQLPELMWPSVEVGGYYVCHHPLLPCFCAERNGMFAVLLGTAMDTDAWTMDGKQIAQTLLERAELSVSQALDYVDVLCGRHVIFFRGSVHTGSGQVTEDFILSDSTGLKCISYDEEMTCFASHVALTAELTGKRKRWKIDLEWKKEGYPDHLPGRMTNYEGVRMLLPNTLAMLRRKEIKRFFPREALAEQTLEEATGQMADWLKKQVDTLVKNRVPMMASLTAGKDSRLTLAALKDCRDQVLFFTYCTEGEDKGSQKMQFDDQIARRLSERLGFQHKTLWITAENVGLENDLVEINGKNVEVHIYPLALPVYLKNLPADRLHIISSALEIGEGWYRTARQRIMAVYPHMSLEQATALIYTEAAINDPLMREATEDFLVSSEYDKLYGCDPYDFFFWEQYAGKRLNMHILSCDLAHDTWNLFNCRKFWKMMLSVPLGDRVSKEIVYRATEKLWPIAMYDGINEESTLADYKDVSFEKVGVDMRQMELICGNVHSKKQVVFRAKKGGSFLSMRFDSNRIQAGDFLQASIRLTTKGDGGGYWLSFSAIMPDAWKWREKCRYRVLLNGEQILEESGGAFVGTAQINVRFQAVREDYELQVRLEALEDVENGLFGWENRLLLERIMLRRHGVKVPLMVQSTSPAASVVR